MRRLMAMATMLLLAFALLPMQALAEEVPYAGYGEGFTDDWWVIPGDEEAPLGSTSEEELLEAGTTINSITLTGINTMFMPGQRPWFGCRVDKSDPNYANLTVAQEIWTVMTDDYTMPGRPLFGGAPGDVYSAPMLTPEEFLSYLPTTEFSYMFAILAPQGYTFADPLTVTYLGKDYEARVLGQGEESSTGRVFVTIFVRNLKGKVSYALPLYRMYNTKTSEHLWTRSKKEYDSAGSGSYADWKAEGVAWYVPERSSKPVYRLYNMKSGDHHYTTSAAEKDKLLASGQWRDEGVAFYSATAKDSNTIKVYRVYNSRLKRGQHHYTKSAAERDSLVKNNGWKDEGIGFYGYKVANPPSQNNPYG